MMECQEPNCRYPATADFHGKKLCQDCWEKYKAEEERMEMEMKSSDW